MLDEHVFNTMLLMRSEMKGREGKGGHFKDVTGRVSHGNLCQENPGCAHEYS